MMLELHAGHDRVAIDAEAGARLVSLIAGGAERMLGREEAPDAPLPVTWGSFVMAPWAGRIEGAGFPWEGERVSLEANWGPHAIHGVVFDVAWSVDEATETSATLSRTFDVSRWPLGGEVRQRFTLARDSLVQEIRITASGRRMPVTAGWHPWFRRPAGSDVAVKVSSNHVLDTTPDLIPTGGVREVSGDTDLRQGPLLGARRLDNVYAAASPPAVLSWSDLELTIDFSPPLGTVVVYTPVEAFCVEPQSGWPDAFNLADRGVEGTGLVVLGPHEHVDLVATWTWRAPS